MSVGVVVDLGELRMLRTIMGAVTPEPLSLRLYVNDRVPNLADVLADYTELDGHDYAPKTLVTSDWTYQSADVGTNTPARAVAPRQAFAFTSAGAPALVYGYLLVGVDSGLLWIAQRFDEAPYRVANDADSIEVDPKIHLRSEYP